MPSREEWRDSSSAMAFAGGLRMLTLRHVVTEAEGVFRIHPEGKALLDYYAGSIAHLLPRHVAC
jgi:hypothetical protein